MPTERFARKCLKRSPEAPKNQKKVKISEIRPVELIKEHWSVYDSGLHFGWLSGLEGTLRAPNFSSVLLKSLFMNQ